MDFCLQRTQFTCWQLYVNLINLDSVCISPLISSIAFYSIVVAKISVNANENGDINRS